ncbi:MAG: SDR family oxidoreductase [Chthonomonadales bacterium]
MKGAKVLVTGGAGFIGSTLVKSLVKQGAEVRVLDNLSSGFTTNLNGLSNRVDFVEGDIRNAIACRNACRGVDFVFHMAAVVSVPSSVADPVTADAVNIGGTLNLLTAARDARARKFIFSSSSAIYGATDRLPVRERDLPMPTSPYGVEKLYGEHMCRLFTELHGLPTIALRYFNVYGPGQRPDSDYAAVIPKFISAMTSGNRPIIHGDGLQSRDFLFVTDVVDANLLAACAESGSGETINIARGSETTLIDLFEQIRAITGKDIAPQFGDVRAGDIRRSYANISQAKKLLKFRPKQTLESGLKRTVAYFTDPNSPGGDKKK